MLRIRISTGLIAFQTGVQELGKYLSAHSQNDSIVTFTFNDTLSTERVAVGDSNQLLPADKVISLCKQYHSDLLLTLDSLNFDFTYEIEVSESDNGKKSRTAVYYLHGYYYLTLYDEAGELLKRTYLHQSMQYATRPVIAWIVPVFEPKNLDKALDEIIKLTDGSAKEYVGMFFSQTVASSEKLYKGKAFNQSNSLILAKKYDEAIVLLKKISNSGDAKVAQKAMHNLSVAEELRKNL